VVVYKITNLINGKVYIGQTIQSLKKRWRDHCHPNSDCSKLARAIQKYGKENFTIEEIENCSDMDSLNKAEEYWIKEHNSIENGYNILKKSFSEDIGRALKEKHARAFNVYKVKIFKKQSPNNKAIYGKGEFVKTYNNQIDCARDLGICDKNMSLCLTGKRTRLSGYIFEYCDEPEKIFEKAPEFYAYKAICIQKGRGYQKGIYKKGKILGKFTSQAECARYLKIKRNHVSICLIGKRPQCKGYIFEWEKK
jgi:group I intron endonuclease